MIESIYWKEYLGQIAKSLRQMSRPPRRTERTCAIVERDITVGFFIVRRLIELNKVSSRTTKRHITCFSYQSTGKSVTALNHTDLERLYDLRQEASHRKAPAYVANQFIHARTCFLLRDQSRNWSDCLVVSDYDKDDFIWRIPVAEIKVLFELAAGDFPNKVEASFNTKKRDYDITTS